MDEITCHLATTLKTLRQARDWSLSQAAEATGVSKAMLGQIERNESSPTVATLWKIATGFNVPFSAFITPASLATAPVYDPRQQSMVVRPLFPFDEQHRFDWFAITLAPGVSSASTPHERGVIEHVVVISGVLEMQTAEVTRQLTQGQGLRFAGDKPHRYTNPGAGTLLFHSLIHYPAGQ